MIERVDIKAQIMDLEFMWTGYLIISLVFGFGLGLFVYHTFRISGLWPGSTKKYTRMHAMRKQKK